LNEPTPALHFPNPLHGYTDNICTRLLVSICTV